MPGRLERDWETGKARSEAVTVGEYFHRIGVSHLFDPVNQDCIEAMQVNSTNPWGFIGFQFGEALLIDLGYYEPKLSIVSHANRDLEVPTFYVGTVACQHFAGGITHHLIECEHGSGYILATDVNRWEGQFTGLDGVRCLADLKTVCSQRRIFMRSLTYNHRSLEDRLLSIELCLLKLENRGITLSGALAAAHLVGAAAAARRLECGTIARDEAGTSVDLYLKKFSGFDIDTRDFATLSIEEAR